MVYKNIIPRDTPIKDIKKLFPHQRKEVKGIEFSQQFGGTEYAIQSVLGCSIEEAREFKDSYASGFPGIAKFKKKGSEFVRKYGYIVLNPITGHKTYWWDFNDWKSRQESFTREFWDDYKEHHKNTGDKVAVMIKEHFKTASLWDRKALNSVTQGTGAIILKDSQIEMFRWVVKNGYFGKILLNNLTHDEANWEFPEDMKDTFPSLLQNMMEKSASKYCKSLPVPAVPEVAKYWIH